MPILERDSMAALEGCQYFEEPEVSVLGELDGFGDSIDNPAQ